MNLDPIGTVAVLVGNPPAIGGYELGEDESGSGGGSGRAKEKANQRCERKLDKNNTSQGRRRELRKAVVPRRPVKSFGSWYQ